MEENNGTNAKGMDGNEEQAPPQGGIITKVEQQKRTKNRYNIYINEAFALSVHEDVLIRHHLLKGAEVDTETLVRILSEEEKNRAYLDAVRLLSSRLRSVHEIRSRLKLKGYGPELITGTVDRLRREGYLNDAEFAQMLTKQRIVSQKKGRHFIKQELQQKGIAKEEIQEAIAQVDEETEYEMARQLAEKRYAGEMRKDPLKARRKIAGFLQRRGYPGSVVSRVLSGLPRHTDESEWEEPEESGDPWGTP
ncbi:regulatory protein RecX [Paenibacillus mucilaginosus]|uniref:Regulatory protein RecX n=3 Tax=Paenibacillus mucilaginosus TaxID=61624 RepID=H6NP95_9BACL|nr:RecX family transcriptional regulator [Paenibacillus mucilaginosus]AEI44260.1 regulatory protein RecX [Paenibacillus mucilaginosus KNP414]AFC31805.1 regulatory protein RecX [Paenibacillus mucilaginosus 3016]AFH64159.1 recombinase RecX [Paenibacillus mucilaginosus K02]MCG7216669.1 RecX family transcriptional regulator [Paenibacillus mucilaginosus]WDM25662.1 RecX family transcriptional regulator [Paenibacillus mucilaginosus]